MAHDRKRGFLSSMFGSRKQKEHEEAADLESKHRLEERIQQILAEKANVTPVFVEENTALMVQEEAEPVVELLPITASVPIRKAPTGDFLLSSFEVPRPYAANQR